MLGNTSSEIVPASVIGCADTASARAPNICFDEADEEVAALKTEAAPMGGAVLDPMPEEVSMGGLAGSVWRARGVLVVALSAFAMSMMSTCVRVVAHIFPSTQTMLARAVIQALLSFSFLKFFGLPLLGTPEVRKRVVIRGLVGATNNWILFFVVTQMEFGDAHAIFFTNSVFTVAFSCLLLGEPLLAVEAVSMTLGMAGVVLIARPPALFGPAGGEAADLTPVVPHAAAVSICFFGAFIGGWVPIIVRSVGKAAHWMSMVFSFAVFGVILSSAALAVGVERAAWPSVGEVGVRPYAILIGIGFLATAAQSMWNFGLQLEKPAVASTAQLVTVPFSFMWQTVFFGERAMGLSVAGAFMVLGGTATILGRRICFSPASVEVAVADDRDAASDK